LHSAAEPLEGISLHPTGEDVSSLCADIVGPVETPYEGGVFTCKLVFGPDFPQTPPKGFFLTKIFHPNVSKAGEICVNSLKRDWEPSKGLAHVLLIIRCLLIVPNPDSALNEEAGRLLLEDYASYFARAQMLTKIHAKASNTVEAKSDEPALKRPKSALPAQKKKSLRRL